MDWLVFVILGALYGYLSIVSVFRVSILGLAAGRSSCGFLGSNESCSDFNRYFSMQCAIRLDYTIMLLNTAIYDSKRIESLYWRTVQKGDIHENYYSGVQ